MSEFIQNNREKQDKLKKIIERLHSGESVEKVKHEFSDMLGDVSGDEISALEQSLINEGMDPEKIQELCEVHVAVFEDSLKEKKQKSQKPGHPVHTYKEENKKIRELLKELKNTCGGVMKKPDWESFFHALDELSKAEYHYQRKENQLFPLLEKKEFTGPTKVMWGKHDEIRAILKEMKKLDRKAPGKEAKELAGKLADKMQNMVFMEENILFPTAIKKLTEPEWIAIRNEEPEIGYAWVQPGKEWLPNAAGPMDKPVEYPEGTVRLHEGALSPQQLDLMLKHLPVDITFVDENDKVRYYTASDDRVFPRSPSIIGRDVQNCHPPKSVHMVERIVQAFKDGEKDKAEFWLQFGDMFVFIQYFCLRDTEGTYKGVIEVTQDIKEIRNIKGEKRLLDWE